MDYIVKSSRGSNSDILANEYAKGVKEAGHDVELLSLKEKDIKYYIKAYFTR
ncbi:hypothetical protein [Holdemanella biformis]|uniref:hypothetical protein n=1 Tax=Holdemanella biformis TaxID=1735 RepID=UPI0015F33F57|nr:hypothetical protein [Holdemanella biformis]